MLGARGRSPSARSAARRTSRRTARCRSGSSPRATYRFVDLVGRRGQLRDDRLRRRHGDDADALRRPAAHARRPAASPAAKSRRRATRRSARRGSACPNCNAPIELHAPDRRCASRARTAATCSTCRRARCACSRSWRRKAKPRIPLGTKGTFPEGEMTVIGYIERSAQVDGDWYPFEEYLLYAPAIGFRWLVSSDGHWSYVQPVATGAVELDGTEATLRRRQVPSCSSARSCASTPCSASSTGRSRPASRSCGEDYVAPPAMLSRETHEQRGELVAVDVHEAARASSRRSATSRELQLGGGTGVAPNQPDPAARRRGAAAHARVPRADRARHRVRGDRAREARSTTHVVSIPSRRVHAAAARPSRSRDANPPNVFFSRAVHARGRQEHRARVSREPDEQLGVRRRVARQRRDRRRRQRRRRAWSTTPASRTASRGREGKRDAHRGARPGAGRRVRAAARDAARRGSRRGAADRARAPGRVPRAATSAARSCVLGIPFLILGIYSYSFERRRWSNSTDGTSARRRRR